MSLMTQDAFIACLRLKSKFKLYQVLAALAIISASILLVSQIPHNASAESADYQQVFSDDFNRAVAAGTAIGNGWTFPGGYDCNGAQVPNPATGITNWKIANNTLRGGAGTCDDRANGGSLYAYKASPMLQPTHNIYNGKIVFDYDNTVSSIYTISGVLARYNPTDGSGVYFGFYEGANNTINQFQARLLRANNFGEANRNTAYTSIHPFTNPNTPLPAHLRIEVTLQDANWEYKIFDIDTSLTDPVYSVKGTFGGLTELAGRTWGLQAFNSNAPYDNVTLYKVSTPLTSSLPTGIVKTGDSLTFTIHDDEDRTLSNFSDGAGGTFSPSSVQLTADNNYVATITYTPTQSGKHTITANVTGGETFKSEILAQPYSTKIGMLGDSITALNSASLGNGLSKVNVAVCGGHAAEFAANSISGAKCGGLAGAQNIGDPWQTIAIDKLKAENVDLVHLMIGSNDIWGTTPQQYKTIMQTNLDVLKAAGIKHAILSKLVWRADAPEYILARMAEYGTVIDELVAESNGYVLAGDSDAYAWFEEDNGANMSDGLHPNAGLGQRTVMDFWTTAITRNLEYQIAPNHTWTNNTNHHIKGEVSTLTHTTDKYFGDFTGIVKIDNTALSNSDYTATAGSTTIELSSNTLNALTVGSHILTVEFYGNVLVSSNFAIAADSQSVCQNGATNFPDCDNNVVNPNNPDTPDVPKTGAQSLSSRTEATTASNALIALAVTTIIIGSFIITRRKTITYKVKKGN